MTEKKLPTPMAGYCILRVVEPPAAPEADADTTNPNPRAESYYMAASSGIYVAAGNAIEVDIPEGARVHLVPGAPTVSYETMPDGHTTARLCDITVFIPRSAEEMN